LLHGEPLIQRVAGRVRPIAAAVTVVADRAEKYADLGLRTIRDLQPGLGPLAGLQTALTDLPPGERWLPLCACDTVVLRPAWLTDLLAARDDRHEAVAFRGRRWQPMPGLYATDALPTVSHLLQTDRRSMQRLLDQLRVAGCALPADWPERWQVNTPDDLAHHVREADAG